jgi:hypothetical protein
MAVVVPENEDGFCLFAQLPPEVLFLLLSLLSSSLPLCIVASCRFRKRYG